MADSSKVIQNVSSGQPISATHQNHIINAVNRVNATPLVSGNGWNGKFSGGPQGTVLPALLDASAGEEYYTTGDVVVITDYLDSQDSRTVVAGADKNFGVKIKGKDSGTGPGRGIAVVVETVDASGQGTVCVTGASLAKVERLSTSPAFGLKGAQLTGSLLQGETALAIGQGVGDVDILWEESTEEGIHYAYVSMPGGNQKGIPAVNNSGAEIPPYSALEVTGEDASGRLEMGKPSEDNLTQVYLSPDYPIPSGLPFSAINPEDGVVQVTQLTGTMAPGDSLGTASGEWYLKEGNIGFTFQGGSATAGRVKATGGGGIFLVKSVAAPSGGTVSVKYVDSNGDVVGDAFTVKTLPDV